MALILVVNVLFPWYAVFILHPMATVYFGTALMLDRFILSIFQQNMIFVGHLLNMHGSKDLRSVNRSRTPWIIVGSHRPMYASIRDNAHDFDYIALMLQFHLEPLFYRYHVDVNLFAHRHSYERTCPMYQERCVSDGITNVLMEWLDKM